MTPWTDTMLHVHYISIKLEKRKVWLCQSIPWNAMPLRKIWKGLYLLRLLKKKEIEKERNWQLGMFFIFALYLKVLQHHLWGLLPFRSVGPWLRRPENLDFLHGSRCCWSADHTLRTLEPVHTRLIIKLEVHKRIQTSRPTLGGSHSVGLGQVLGKCIL